MSHGPQVSAALLLRELRKRDAIIEAQARELELYRPKKTPKKRGQWFAQIERQVKDA